MVYELNILKIKGNLNLTSAVLSMKWERSIYLKIKTYVAFNLYSCSFY